MYLREEVWVECVLLLSEAMLLTATEMEGNKCSYCSRAWRLLWNMLWSLGCLYKLHSLLIWEGCWCQRLDFGLWWSSLCREGNRKYSEKSGDGGERSRELHGRGSALSTELFSLVGFWFCSEKRSLSVCFKETPFLLRRDLSLKTEQSKNQNKFNTPQPQLTTTPPKKP